MKDWDSSLRQMDLAIREGKGAAVKREIERLAERKVPRSHATPLAQMSWRTGTPLVGIRLLGPYVRPKSRNPSEPSPEEIAEYAQCLVRIGASVEALDLLKKIAASRLPEAWLYEASAHMSRWDYAAAFPLVMRYAKAPGLSAYQRLVGRINVASCLVCLRKLDEAIPLLRDLLHETSLRHNYLLHSNALELSAQSFALGRRWKEVERCLAQAEPTLVEAGTSDGLYVRKWKAIAALIRCKADGPSLSRLRGIRQEALDTERWEAVRQCDEFEATYRRDESLLARLYYGTPHDAFRKRLLEDYGPVRLPDVYDWPIAGRPGPVFDLVEGTWKGRATILRPHQRPLRLLAVLASDFYAPFRTAALHNGLYPNEWYRPSTSPFRIYEAIKVLRADLAKASVPLAIERCGAAYRLVAKKPCSIRMRREGVRPRWAKALESIRAARGAADFSVNEVSGVLAMNPRTVLRWLEEAEAAGAIARQGKGRVLRFVFR